jgi:hypothetical protein
MVEVKIQARVFRLFSTVVEVSVPTETIVVDELHARAVEAAGTYPDGVWQLVDEWAE